jgi:squalene-associated FAD-dependent desaturase
MAPLNVVVVGAGFSGLAAAIDLQDRGHRVTLLERRGVLGGRATSYADAVSGGEIDNGTHILVGAYRATVDLLRRAGALDLIERQKNLSLSYADERARTELRCPALPAPLHLLGGLMRFPLSWPARWDALRFAWHARFGRAPVGLTLSEYFRATGQGPEVREALWEPLARAIVNEEPERAAAILFYNVYREAFLRTRGDSALMFVRAGLGALHARLASRFASGGGTLHRRTLATAVRTKDGAVAGVVASVRATERGSTAPARGEPLDADAVVLAVPPAAAHELLPLPARESPPFDALRDFGSAPIVSVEVWLDRPVVDGVMVGLRDHAMEWVFDKGRLFGRPGPPQHLSFILSAAHASIRRPNGALVSAAESALRRCFPAAMREARIARSLVLREPDATFSSRPELEPRRPGPQTPIAGLFLAGDWTNTGLPATIEGAVRSGFAAARAVDSWVGR